MIDRVVARRAGADDADELVRLRSIMLGSMTGAEPALGEWSERAVASLRRRLPLPDSNLAAFVVDQPSPASGLAACAVGVFEERLGSPANPSGRAGYVFNVATDPQYRRRGFSRSCMQALIAWFAANDVAQINLRASNDGLPLYQQLGFTLQHGPPMQLVVS